MIFTRTAAAAAGFGLAVSLSACTSSQDTADANAEFCTSVATVQTEVADLKALVASDATIEQIQDQQAAVSKAVEDSANEVQGVAVSVQNEVKAANQAYADAMQGITTDMTLSEAQAQAQAAIAAWDKAIASIRTEVGCK